MERFAREGDTTNPALLGRVADWADRLAWSDFFKQYDPLLRRWCSRYGIRGDSADELCQRLWIEIARRMRDYDYDPGRTFRGWLWFLFRSRTIDFFRRSAKEAEARDAALSALVGRLEATTFDDEQDESDLDAESRFLPLLRECERVHESVRGQVRPESWQAFWLIAIEGLTVAEAAESLGKEYATVYRACQRVRQRLRDEGRRRLPKTP